MNSNVVSNLQGSMSLSVSTQTWFSVIVTELLMETCINDAFKPQLFKFGVNKLNKNTGYTNRF